LRIRTVRNVSFDDGDHWQSLKLNMPMTSIRDLVIKDDDLVVGTPEGRSGFWMTSHRCGKPEGDEYSARVVQTQTALRIRWSMNPDTPLPQEEPGGQTRLMAPSSITI